MAARFRWAVGTGALALVVLGALLATSQAQNTARVTPRISFQIATGSTAGTYFPIGTMIAGLISHPPGVGRCARAELCGPAGLIASTRASEGSTANILAVDSGAVESGLAQADVVAQALAGTGAFARTGRVRNIRVIANLYPETVHLVAATRTKITTVSGLRGKRVSLSTTGSGTIATARLVLASYGLSEQTVVPNYDAAERAADLMRNGQLDAFFYVGGAPVPLIADLVERGEAVIVPIAARGRDALLKRNSHLSSHAIPAGIYGDAAIETISMGALWITHASQSENVIYAMTKALYHPSNRALLNNGNPLGRLIGLDHVAATKAAPLHQGAERYYREAGVLAQNGPAGKS